MSVIAPAPGTGPSRRAVVSAWAAAPRVRLALWPLAALVGIAAEWAAGGGAGVARVLTDLAAGWSMIACGLIAWDRRPASRLGVLMTATGFAWFAGNFITAAAYVHRGPLVHAVLGYPTGRVSRLAGAVVAVFYVTGAIAPLAEEDRVTIAICAVLVAAAVARLVRASAAERRDRSRALLAAAAIALPLAAGGALRLSGTSAAFEAPVLTAYELAVVGVAILLLDGLLGRTQERATAVVVELGDAPSGVVRDALSRALGDPALQVGYWVPATGAYVDEQGVALVLPAPGAARAITRIKDDAAPLAIVVHEPGLLDDAALVRRVASVLRLAVANARLQGEARAHLDEVRASRRRVLEQADAQRDVVERRIRAGPEQRLAALEAALGRARASASPASDRVLAEAEDELRRARAELWELVRGLRPATLSDRGLGAAVTELARRAPVPVDVRVITPELPQAPEATVYFLCSEALVNIAKHAHATRAGVSVTADDGRVRLVVWDDGCGGAHVEDGAGLRGLRDRLEAAGGILRIDSPPGGGTRVLAELPLLEP